MTALVAGATACTVAGFALAWAGARRAGNAAWVDVAWSFAFFPVVILCAGLGEAPWLRRLALALIVGAWSLRLTVHLARRVAADATEDPRYAALRRMFAPKPWLGFFGFFQIQGILVVLLSLPFYSTAMNLVPFPTSLEILGACVVLGGLLGESLADQQLAQFRSRPQNAGTVCRVGLWAWSRHPNYFFEWAVWLGFALLGTEGPGGLWVWIAPAVMFVLLTKVTGIPPAEARSLASRGESYRLYQQEVSAFFPWPPRRKFSSKEQG